MGFVGFLKFALNCFDFLAWPLFALICPLYASVRAIATNSNSDTRNLVSYWIVFHLISLFEHAFLKLIERLPFWPHMKLMAICWLWLPHFNGACYVYECLIRPCLSVNPQVAINRFVEHKEDLPLNAESFLAMAERYVIENGSEALEKLMDRKAKCVEKPNLAQFEKKTIMAMEIKEKTMASAVKENKAVEVPAAAIGGGGNKVEEGPASVKVQKEWTCAVCQVTTSCEKSLKSHLHGEKHKAKREELKGSKQANKIKKQEDKVTGGRENKVYERPASVKGQKEWTCAICQVTTTCEENLKSHLHGRKHMAKRAELKASIQANKIKKQEDKVTGGGENKVEERLASVKVQKKWTCAVCQVTTTCEKNLKSHLHGQKHKAKVAELKASIQPNKINKQEDKVTALCGSVGAHRFLSLMQLPPTLQSHATLYGRAPQLLSLTQLSPTLQSHATLYGRAHTTPPNSLVSRNSLWAPRLLSIMQLTGEVDMASYL